MNLTRTLAVVVIHQPLSSPLLSLSTSISSRIMGVRAIATYKFYEKSSHMQRLLNRKGAKTKKNWFKPHLGDASEVEPKKTNKGISQNHSIRLRQHSHVLYSKVTEIINTGELSQEILEKHVSITMIRVAKDMNSVNVYWEADRSDWEEVENLLVSHSGKLRSILISYHVLGRIPHIVFVKDKSASNLHQLKELFEKADYGPDYLPGVNNNDHEKELDGGLNKTESDLNNLTLQEDLNLLSADEFSHIDSTNDHYKIENSGITMSSNTEPNTNSGLPFRSNLYGLDRNEMIKKVLAKKSKSRKNSINDTTQENVNNNSITMPLPTLDMNTKEISTLISPVLAKMKLRKKLARQERKVHEKLLEIDSVDF